VTGRYDALDPESHRISKLQAEKLPVESISRRVGIYIERANMV
jgi:hypothetical protein